MENPIKMDDLGVPRTCLFFFSFCGPTSQSLHSMDLSRSFGTSLRANLELGSAGGVRDISETRRTVHFFKSYPCQEEIQKSQVHTDYHLITNVYRCVFVYFFVFFNCVI